jgi:hypothetical protein
MYWEVWGVLQDKTLTEAQETKYKQMLEVIETMRHKPTVEPSIAELMGEVDAPKRLNGNTK